MTAVHAALLALFLMGVLVGWITADLLAGLWME